jgi:hypothetical protein
MMRNYHHLDFLDEEDDGYQETLPDDPLSAFNQQANLLMLKSSRQDANKKQRACFTENYLVFSLNERMP